MSAIHRTIGIKTESNRGGQGTAFGPLMEALTRLGYAVRGLIYVTMGLLAVQVALGKGGILASPQGAIAALGKQPVGRCPILKLQAASGQQAGDGSASQTQQRTQREGLRPLVDSLLGAAGLALAPELLEAVEEERRVFFRTGGGAWGRRSASRDLSSMSHSTVSPRENSMA